MDEQEEVQQNNMISNLPLLFANGYPTSLDKITEPQLQNFIPFMVQCSLGHINLQGKIDCSEPEWWPEDLPFTTPFTKPKKFAGNWMEKMKEIVIICYQFHKSVFLLRFCNDLAAYEHASLRFINNYNSTTSLFERRSNKLLVTFRNENMSYDQPQRSRKCLLQAKSKNGRQSGQDLQQMMVEPAPFDIYLCDNCDAELYSKEAILEHEKTCMVDDDDVILCDTPEPPDVNDQQTEQQQINEIDELRKNFLLNFSLHCRGEDIRRIRNVEKSDSSGSASTEVKKEESTGFMIIDRNKRMPRRNRAVHSLSRCPTIPLSSPAGQLLLRTTKTVMTKEYLSERLDRMERFCLAPLLSRSSSKPKYFDKKFQLNTPHCTFKKPQDYSSHVYVFPRRQFSQRRRTENFLFLNSSLIRRCRPISVRLKKITDNEMKGRRTLQSHKLNIKLTRDTSRSSNWKISSSTSTTEEIIVDTIDLCSSESEDDSPAYITATTTNVQSTTTLSLQTANIAGNVSGELYASRTTLTTTTVGSQAGVSVSASRSNLSLSRKHLEQIRPCINSSEVSLIPIRKSLNNCSAIKYGNLNVTSPLINIVPSTINDTSSSAIVTGADNNNFPLYEGNILLSSSTAATIAAGDSGITLTKPLRPVYIFPNYPANPLAAIVTSEIPTDSTAAIATNYRNHNQENHVQNNSVGNIPNSGGVIISKRTSNVGVGSLTIAPTASTTPVTAEWYTGATAAGNSNQNQSIERERDRDRDRDRASRSLTLMQSFGSPGRVISIDLTS